MSARRWRGTDSDRIRIVDVASFPGFVAAAAPSGEDGRVLQGTGGRSPLEQFASALSQAIGQAGGQPEAQPTTTDPSAKAVAFRLVFDRLATDGGAVLDESLAGAADADPLSLAAAALAGRPDLVWPPLPQPQPVETIDLLPGPVGGNSGDSATGSDPLMPERPTAASSTLELTAPDFSIPVPAAAEPQVPAWSVPRTIAQSGAVPSSAASPTPGTASAPPQAAVPLSAESAAIDPEREPTGPAESLRSRQRTDELLAPPAARSAPTSPHGAEAPVQAVSGSTGEFDQSPMETAVPATQNGPATSPAGETGPLANLIRNVLTARAPRVQPAVGEQPPEPRVAAVLTRNIDPSLEPSPDEVRAVRSPRVAAAPAVLRPVPLIPLTGPVMTAAAFASDEQAAQAARAAQQVVEVVSQEVAAATSLTDWRASLAYRRMDAAREETAAAAESAIRAAVSAESRPGTDSASADGQDSSRGRGGNRPSTPDATLAFAGSVRAAVASRAFDVAAEVSAKRTDEFLQPSSDGEPLNQAIVKSLKMQFQQGVGEARLRLNPEYLGELSVSLRVQGSTVTAVLQSDSATVRGWIETHQGELRRALADAGLTLDRLVIDPDGHSQEQREPDSQPDQQRSLRRRPEPGRFEAML